MNRDIIRTEIRDLVEVIREQQEIILAHTGNIPQIELDILMGNVRKLYERLWGLQAAVGQSAVGQLAVGSQAVGGQGSQVATVPDRSQSVSVPVSDFSSPSPSEPALSSPSPSQPVPDRSQSVSVSVSVPDFSSPSPSEPALSSPSPSQPVPARSHSASHSHSELPSPSEPATARSHSASHSHSEPLSLSPSEPALTSPSEPVPVHSIQPEELLAAIETPVEAPVQEISNEAVLPQANLSQERAKEFSKPSAKATPLATLFDEPETLADKFAGQASLYDKIAAAKEDKSIATKLQKNPVSDLKKSIGINEKFSFINELFDGNLNVYNEAIDKLNSSASYTEAVAFLDGTLAENHQWDKESSAYLNLKNLVERRFGA